MGLIQTLFWTTVIMGIWMPCHGFAFQLSLIQNKTACNFTTETPTDFLSIAIQFQQVRKTYCLETFLEPQFESRNVYVNNTM